MGGIIGLAIIALIIILIIIVAVVLSRRKGKSPDNSRELQLLQQNNAEQMEMLRKTMQEQIESMRQEYGDRFADMPSEALVEELQGRVDNARKFTIREIDAANRDRLEKLTEITEELKKDAREEMAEYAKKLIKESSVSREEFDKMEKRLDKFAGDDTKEVYIKFLSEMFNSRKQSTINWKCNLIKLLRNGLVPEIDQGKIAREGIPTGTTLTKFLKEMVKNNMIDKQTVDSYKINEEFQWLFSYIDKPDWLREEFERRDLMAKKEKEYQKWLKKNLDKVETGLLKEERESSMETGTIDFFCRDQDGKPVGLELKYPKASKSDAKQLIAYAKEQRESPGGEGFRGMMVAPEIPESLKTLLDEQDLDWREIPWDGEDEAESQDVDETEAESQDVDETEAESQDVDETEAESQDVDEEEWNPDMHFSNNRR
jgi:RecB family endonuclease NucS